MHHLKKISRGACPRTPLAKRMALPCRFATCKFPNLKIIILAPPLTNPGYAPVTHAFLKTHMHTHPT